MKKIVLYILILVTLFGLFNPIFNAHASKTNPNEHCVGEPPTNEPCVKPYALLEPLPGMDNAEEPFYPSDKGALGTYLDIIIKLFIGLCAVLAVVMIVIGGIEYSTSELISSKEAGKDRIRGALLGLLLALGAYTILFTINPNLLNTDVEIGDVTLNVILKEFTIVPAVTLAPAQLGPDQKIDTKFNATEACAAAKAAGAANKVNPALIMAVFTQETSNGRGKGGCTANNGSNIDPRQLPALRTIANRFYGGNINAVPMSCDPGEGRGGAIGLMQGLPDSWRIYGNGGNPWDLNDAFAFAARHLVGGGVQKDEALAACRYHDGNGVRSCRDVGYRKAVMDLKAGYEEMFNEGKCYFFQRK